MPEGAYFNGRIMVSKTIDSCSNQDAPAMKISKKRIFLSLPVALLSLEIFFGVILGYILPKIMAGKKAGQAGVIKSIILPIGKHRLHVHHWLYGFGILTSVFLFNFSIPWPQFSIGFLGGFIFQGIFSYPDWYKIFHKIA